MTSTRVLALFWGCGAQQTPTSDREAPVSRLIDEEEIVSDEDELPESLPSQQEEQASTHERTRRSRRTPQAPRGADGLSLLYWDRGAACLQVSMNLDRYVAGDDGVFRGSVGRTFFLSDTHFSIDVSLSRLTLLSWLKRVRIC